MLGRTYTDKLVCTISICKNNLRITSLKQHFSCNNLGSIQANVMNCMIASQRKYSKNFDLIKSIK